jgi:hypothetical protein
MSPSMRAARCPAAMAFGVARWYPPSLAPTAINTVVSQAESKRPLNLAVTHKWCGELIHLPELLLATARRS